MAIAPWVPVIGWFVLPFLSFSVNKLLSSLDFHLSRKLQEFKFNVIPSLKQILGEVTEKRMLGVGAAKDEGKGSVSDPETLGELERLLKFELYNIGDFLDLIEYRRIEKEVISRDGKSVGTTISSWVLQAIGDCKACCRRSSFGQKLWWHAQNLSQKLRGHGDKLQQWALNLDGWFWGLVAQLAPASRSAGQQDGLLPQYNQGSAGQPSQAAASATRSLAEFRDTKPGSATSTPDDSAGSATESRGDSQHRSAEAPTLDAAWNSLVQMICGWLVNGFSALCSLYLSACELRDWSYELVGVKNDDGTATDWLLRIYEIIRLRKKIMDIEYIVSYSKNSALLDKKSSSSTPKDADKESSSTPKDADKESSSSKNSKNSAEATSSSTQKEIDDLCRDIEQENIEQEVFGREDDREKISMMLRGPDTYVASSSTSQPYSVIGIHGFTGSGKSTLAQYVCDYEKKERHFNPVMFIQVGKTFSVGGIFRDMLEQITLNRPPKDEGLKSLKTRLEEVLNGRRFLLVLDDLWVNDDNHQKEQAILFDMLRLSAALSGSRILVTAQKTDAAEALGAHLQLFSIPDLKEQVYFSLFMHHALPFATDDKYREHEGAGREIANKLCRSPIAAVTVGKQLKNKDISFWETTAKLEVLDKTMGPLWWSYQQLGVDIRQCFAYCSIFPKGYKLERDELVRIWIAQGFIKTRASNATEELEDIGQRYFDQLVAFSFVQVKIFYERMKVFTIHDLLHELARRVSANEFFGIGLNNGLPKDIPQGTHHLYIETNNGAEIIKKIVDFENLRTLIIEEPYTKPMERNHDLEQVLGQLFMRLTKLRVLIIKLNFIDELSIPASVDHMNHLRYLCFCSHGGLSSLILPRTFSKLHQIQTVDFGGQEVSCPEDMAANLVRLRHISDQLLVPNIGRLTSLQTLTSFRVEEQGYGLKQLEHLNKLRGTLWIENLWIVKSKEEALEAHLGKKKELRKLGLGFGSGLGDPDVEAEVLEGLCPPKDLQELFINDYEGSRYPSWMLSDHHPGAPKQLRRLELTHCRQLPSIPELFIGLRELRIEGCYWDTLPDNMECLVSLQKLDISYCHKMELLPALPRKSLETIIIVECHLLSKTFEEEGHENWRKIQHIPKKYIV